MPLNTYLYKQMDALSFLGQQASKSIKLIMTSPPYNIGKEYETKISLNKYLENMCPIIEECVRVLSDQGSIVWEVGNYVDQRTSEIYPLDIYFYEILKQYKLQLRNRIIWHFGHGLHCKKRFSGRYETLLWFTKTNNYTFNLDVVRVPSKYPNKKAFKGKNKGKLSGNPKGKNPEDVWDATIERLYDDWERQIWDVPNVKNNHPEKTIHPCQFPIEIAERCVLALTNENDIVYDPFAGVGSTLIAALKNGRRAYGTELVKKYVDIGNERIKKLLKNELKTRPIYQKIPDPIIKDTKFNNSKYEYMKNNEVLKGVQISIFDLMGE